MMPFLAEITPVAEIKPDPRVQAITEQIPALTPQLCQTLYGTDAPTHTYMLVDATLRADVVGIFDLDTIDLPTLCLFDGEALEKYAQAAPWITDISISDPKKDDLIFHNDFFENHWPEQTCVLIQTQASLLEVKRHLRHFVRLPVIDDGNHRYFRFWDGRVLPDFLRALALDGPRARRMAVTEQDHALIYTCLTPMGPTSISPDMDRLTRLPIKAMHLTYADFDATARAEKEARYGRIAARIKDDFKAPLADKTLDEVTVTVRAAAQRFSGFGFREHQHIHFFAVWSTLYGLGFEEADTTGRLQEICRSDAPERARFDAFRTWFDTFTMAA